MSAAQDLIQWNAARPILYPWIGESNPYRILLSEFLLQQTRSDQALPYYKSMLEAFPSIKALANASEDVLMKQWQGLGYYSRAQNLHKTAKQLMALYNGHVPEHYDDLIKLPGIGPYTAAAISSFAFGECRAVVDGNVYRVLARLNGISTPINQSSARQEFTEIAMKLLGKADPAAFNQAIMNLGAHLCTPKAPDCEECPLVHECQAYASGRQADFPVKMKKKPNRDRYFHFIDITYRGRTILEKRGDRDIWKGLYQFPLIERSSTRAMSSSAISQFLQQSFSISQWQVSDILKARKQTLSHQSIHARFYKIAIKERPRLEDNHFTLVFRKNLENFAFPRSVSWYLNTRES